MDDILEIAEFTSGAVSPILSDDHQVNPEVYGAELAYWLCRALAAAGCETGYPIAEDWGWFLEYETEAGSMFAIHCGNVDGSKTRWLLSLRRFGRKLFGRYKPPFEDAAVLVDQVLGVLNADDSVTELDVRWPT